jgi:hypothetical protein
MHLPITKKNAQCYYSPELVLPEEEPAVALLRMLGHVYRPERKHLERARKVLAALNRSAKPKGSTA